MKRYLIPIALILGLACALVAECRAQGSTGGMFGGYYFAQPTYETVYEAPVYQQPVTYYQPQPTYRYIPYRGETVFGTYFGNRPVYVQFVW